MGKNGFTLTEVLISLLFVTIAISAMLQALSFAFRNYSLAAARREEAVRRWNETREVRESSEAAGTPVWIVPGARPLFRSVVDGGSSRHWEVLRAEK